MSTAHSVTVGSDKVSRLGLPGFAVDVEREAMGWERTQRDEAPIIAPIMAMTRSYHFIRPMPKPSPQRILVCRIDNLGDVVMVMPELRWLKSHHPALRIELAVRDYAVELARRIPWVDRVWTPEQVAQAVDAGEPPPDAVFHLQSTRALLRDCAAWGIAQRVGNLFRSAHWWHCNRWVAFSKRRMREHESWLCWRFFRVLFGPEPTTAQWDALLRSPAWLNAPGQAASAEPPQHAHPPQPSPIGPPGAAPSMASLALPRHSIEKPLRVLLHPCSNGNGRQWPLAHFDALVRALLAAGHAVTVTGSAAEREKLQSWLSTLPGSVEDLVGKVSLPEFMNRIAQADCLVASGTGPLHLASASGVHAVGIFPPIAHLGVERWKPIGPRVTTLQTPCRALCRRACTNLDCTCMAEVLPSAVLAAVNPSCEAASD